MARTHWVCFLFCYVVPDLSVMFQRILRLDSFPSFWRTADVMAPSLSGVFRRQVRLGSFPPCWRQANVTPILKGQPFSSLANY